MAKKGKKPGGRGKKAAARETEAERLLSLALNLSEALRTTRHAAAKPQRVYLFTSSSGLAKFPKYVQAEEGETLQIINLTGKPIHLSDNIFENSVGLGYIVIPPVTAATKKGKAVVLKASLPNLIYQIATADIGPHAIIGDPDIIIMP